jgi:formamidopyrimidine-DNA glycosylase
MPEGPEVWILSLAINKYYDDPEKTSSYGKHLFINDKKEDWSFGLTGKVCINEKDELERVDSGWLYGNSVPYTDLTVQTSKYGINWMTVNRDDLIKEIFTWNNKKNRMAGLLIDQTRISGFGVAWGSELLLRSDLKPTDRACDQYIGQLIDSILILRSEIHYKYNKELEKMTTKEEIKNFINSWFTNLYEIRDMYVYKKSEKVTVLGRTWWV